MKIKAALIGAAGLSGLELIHWLRRHPHVELKVLTSSKYAGKALAEVFPEFVGLPHVFERHEASLEGCDVAFLAVPNQASLDLAPRLLAQGLRVIDLSGVYRLRDLKAFQKFYKLTHTSPHWLEQAVFGLPEMYAEGIKQARLIANPGCYPTGSLLGLLPFGDLLSKLDRPPIIDAKSGVTGAGGRVEDDTTNYVEVNENFKAYKVFNHQHLPEIQEYLEALTPYRAQAQGDVIFTPHLLPLNRGILSTIYLHFAEPLDPAEVQSRFAVFSQSRPFVHLLPVGQMPDLQMIQHSNRCMIGLASDASQRNWIVITAIDNLIKGASGQAIQNMNLMFGFPETTCLL